MTPPEPDAFEYAAFLSYSTDPDYQLVRQTEAFLERFHRELPHDVRESVPAMKICADGADFPKTASSSSNSHQDAISTLIQDGLRRSAHLVVFCSVAAAKSPWVDLEIKWFLSHRGTDYILLVVSEGTDDAISNGTIFPPSALAAKLDSKPWYDFRQGARRRRNVPTKKWRDFEDARVQLACHLNGTKAGDVLPLWRREQARLRRKTRQIRLAVTITLIALMIIIALAIPQVSILNAINRLEEASIAVTDTGSMFSHEFEIDYLQDQPLDVGKVARDIGILSRFGHIRRLDLSFALLPSLEGLEFLREVDLLKLEESRFPHLAPLRHLRYVETLGLSDNPNLRNDALEILRNVQGLKHLDLSNCANISDGSLAAIKDMQLETLRINRCPNITNRSIPLLVRTQLKTLEISRSGIKVDIETARALLESATLKEVVVGPEVGEAELSLLRTKFHVPRIKTFNTSVKRVQIVPRS